ncbi:hypothetical protein JCM5296_005365 [Sporobolomyces johnsonii]
MRPSIARISRQLAPTPRLKHSCATALSTPPPPLSSPGPPLEVDDLCLPLHAPYTLSSLLPSPSSSRTPTLSRETLLKLHHLAALVPPASEAEWADLAAPLDELVSLVQAVRDVDTSSLAARLREGESEDELVDARVRAEAQPGEWDQRRRGAKVHDDDKEGLEVERERLLALAERREGAYYIAPMPENVRTRKRASNAAAAIPEDEY